MPRARDRVDDGDDDRPIAGSGGGRRSSSNKNEVDSNPFQPQAPPQQQQTAVATAPAATINHSNTNFLEDNPDLLALEQRLNDEVDEDFFDDPRRFHTLPRVIDVLGIQMIDDATVQQSIHDSSDLTP